MVPLLADCAVKDGNHIYFASYESSVIFSLNLLTGGIEIVSYVPEEIFFGYRPFGDFLCWRDRFVLIPAHAKNIWIVDRKFEHWEKIELEFVDIEGKFFKAMIIDNKIYALRHSYPYSVCVNLETYEVSIMNGTDENFFTSAININNEIYYPSCNSNKVFKYHVETEELMVFDTGAGNYNGILYFEDHFYLAPRDGRQLIIWSGQEERVIDIHHCNALGIFEFGKKIYVPATGTNESFYIDLDGCVKEWKMAEMFLMARSLDNETDCLMDRCGKIYIFDHAVGDVKVFVSEIDEDEIKTVASKAKAVIERKMYYEMPMMNLKQYLTERMEGMEEKQGRGSVGFQIWTFVSK